MNARDLYNLVHPGDEFAWANLPAEEVERWKAMRKTFIDALVGDCAKVAEKLRLDADDAEGAKALYEICYEAADFIDGLVR